MLNQGQICLYVPYHPYISNRCSCPSTLLSLAHGGETTNLAQLLVRQQIKSSNSSAWKELRHWSISEVIIRFQGERFARFSCDMFLTCAEGLACKENGRAFLSSVKATSLPHDSFGGLLSTNLQWGCVKSLPQSPTASSACSLYF